MLVYWLRDSYFLLKDCVYLLNEYLLNIYYSLDNMLGSGEYNSKQER